MRTWTLRHLFATTYQRVLRRRPARPLSRPVRLRVEPLEARVLPAGDLLTVNAGPDLRVRVGESISFTGSYDGGSTANASTAWDFNYYGYFNPADTGTLTPSHTFPYAGTYRVALRVTDDFGNNVVDELKVTAGYDGPTATAGADQTISAGGAVTFSGAYTEGGGTVSLSNIAWDFDYTGAGSYFYADATGTLTPTRQYYTPGTYTVALQVTDDRGNADISFLTVTVNAVTATVNAGPDRTAAAGEAVAFIGDARLLNGATPAAIEWDFQYSGYGMMMGPPSTTTFNPDPAATGSLTPSHTFTSPGTYTAALRVTDSDGNVLIDTATVTVTRARPVLTVGPDVTIDQGQAANLAVQVSCPDPVTVQWSFADNGGYFYPDYSADGQLTPSHTYFKVGTHQATVRVTNTIDGTAAYGRIRVTVNNLAPTATVTAGPPAPEMSAVTVVVSDLADANPAAVLGFEADWTGSGEFEPVPAGQWYFDYYTGAATLRHTYDDNGTYAATIRVVDNEGGAADYPVSLVVDNLPPTISGVGPDGGSPWSVGPGVPIRITGGDPSPADEAAGLTYVYRLDDGPAQSGTSAEFILPTPPADAYGYGSKTYRVRAHVEDKDGGVSPTIEQWITVYLTNTTFYNSGTGSVLLNGTWEIPPNQSHTFSSPVTNLTVTLLTSGAYYSLSTNSSFGIIDYAPGVTGVNLSVGTYGSYYGSVIGDGKIGPISLPGGGSRLNVSARGNFGGVTGPGGTGPVGAEGFMLAFRDLTGPITGLDKIGSISARWLNGPVTVGYGIGWLSAHGIGAALTSHRFGFDNTANGSASSLGMSIGRGGASAPLDLGRVQSFTTAGPVGELYIRLLTGTVSLQAPRGSIGSLRLGATLGSAQIDPGPAGRIGTLTLDEAAAAAPPRVQFFPLGMQYVIASGSVADRFWALVPDNLAVISRNGLYQVHHSYFEMFRDLWAANGINIDAVDNLRAVQVQVHTEINQQVQRWVQDEMRSYNPNWNYNSEAHQLAFKRRIANDRAFYERLTAFRERIMTTYADYMFRATDRTAQIRTVMRRMDSQRARGTFVTNEGRRTGQVFQRLALALAVFGIIGEGVASANAIANPTPQAEAAWTVFESRYRSALSWSLRHNATPPRNSHLMPLKDAFIDYLNAIQIPQSTVNTISGSLEVHFGTHP